MINNINMSKIYLFLKRGADIILAIMGLIVTIPLFIILIVIIKLEDRGPAFYKHKRVGKHGKNIYIYKFRSMVQNSEEVFKKFTKEQKEEYEKFYKLENDPRITKVGKFIRKTSLDEIPQLLNILKGDMSFVGPRPVVTNELSKFGENSKLLLSVKPGLTGLWACSGRSDTTYEERVALELYYIQNRSVKLDTICFAKTFKSVLKGRGAK